MAGDGSPRQEEGLRTENGSVSPTEVEADAVLAPGLDNHTNGCRTIFLSTRRRSQPTVLPKDCSLTDSMTKLGKRSIADRDIRDESESPKRRMLEALQMVVTGIEEWDILSRTRETKLLDELGAMKKNETLLLERLQAVREECTAREKRESDLKEEINKLRNKIATQKEEEVREREKLLHEIDHRKKIKTILIGERKELINKIFELKQKESFIQLNLISALRKTKAMHMQARKKLLKSIDGQKRTETTLLQDRAEIINSMSKRIHALKRREKQLLREGKKSEVKLCKALDRTIKVLWDVTQKVLALTATVEESQLVGGQRAELPLKVPGSTLPTSWNEAKKAIKFAEADFTEAAKKWKRSHESVEIMKSACREGILDRILGRQEYVREHASQVNATLRQEYLHPCNRLEVALQPCDERESTLHPCDERESTPHPCDERESTPHPCDERESTPHPCDERESTPHPCDELTVNEVDTLKIAYRNAKVEEVSTHDLTFPKNSCVDDLIKELKTKVELSSTNAELRILAVFYHKIFKIFSLDEKIESIIEDVWTLRAEEVPVEEKELGVNDRLIHCYHFLPYAAQKHKIQNFGEPFFLVVRENETLAEVKVRVHNKLQVPDDEFLKYKFAYVSLGRPEYLRDDVVVASLFEKENTCSAWDFYLGLEHSDISSTRAHQKTRRSSCPNEQQTRSSQKQKNPRRPNELTRSPRKQKQPRRLEIKEEPCPQDLKRSRTCAASPQRDDDATTCPPSTSEEMPMPASRTRKPTQRYGFESSPPRDHGTSSSPPSEEIMPVSRVRKPTQRYGYD